MRNNVDEIIVEAPGRICLFGDHQDYLGLPVIACAIDRYITLKATKNTTNIFKISMPDIDERRTIAINETFSDIEAGDYFVSSLKVLRSKGCIPSHGYDVLITSNLAINAGLSSSSAVIVAWVKFLLTAFGSEHPINNEFIGEMAYQAEVVEHNAPGGYMDQYTIANGEVLFIETGKSTNFQKIANTVQYLVIGESGVKKDTLKTLSNLKEKAMMAIHLVEKENPNFTIRSSNLADYELYQELLPDDIKPIFLAALKNYHLTIKALMEFNSVRPSVHKLGVLMNEHHSMLKDKLHITVPIIDEMITGALDAGAYGAKIVGSGGGGCIVAMTPEDKQQFVINAMYKAGAKKAYTVEVSEGVKLLSQNGRQ
ncbi:mevalonate kinase family protein [Spongiivirga citrea]|uniref:Galactokinase n=1 Tax=Spongiivirga citrea TaxID=1481457 RepID=A0A6M0CL64_9FLAO|nr:galactokinase family protein [Spongiivirga citrea]NER18676.1 galactokinase [Spongiivirga citrea]